METSTKKVINLKDSLQLAQHIEKLFNEKVLDLFLSECERLLESGIELKDFGAFHKLPFDLDVQYKSMKRVVAESDILLKKAYEKDEQDEAWKQLQMNELCTISVRTNKTLMELKSHGILEIDIKHALIMAYLIKLYT